MITNAETPYVNPLENSPTDERLARAKAGLDAPAHEGDTLVAVWEVDDEPLALEMQGYDPRAKTMEDKPKLGPLPVSTAERMLECWYLFLIGGRIKHAGTKEDAGGVGAGDEFAAAAEYVEAVPMYWEKDMSRILFHKLNGNPWAFWYGPETRTYAASLYEGFRQALRDRLKEKPFYTVTASQARPMDHLEQADAANDELQRSLKRLRVA